MDGSVSAEAFLFEGFRLDRGGLYRLGSEGGADPVPLGSRAGDLLWLLVEHHGELVSRDEIVGAVWRGMAVEEANLTMQISALRRVLDQRRPSSCIQTVIGRGYRFTAPVKRASPPTRLSNHHPPRLSIVVLPFANLGNDLDQEHLADALTLDLTTDLSRIEGLFVIAGRTALTFKGKPVDAREAARDLGVRYVLEGAVRCIGTRLRINTQLVDGASGGQIWAERFDCDRGDFVNVQDELVGRIARALQLELVRADAGMRGEHPDALDFLLRGRAAMAKPLTRDSYVAVVAHFERALAIDPQCAEAQGWLAHALVGRTLDLLTDTPDKDLARAEDLAARAAAAAPRSMIAHQGKAQVLRAQRRWEEAILEYERVIEINRNYPSAYAQLGTCKLLARGAVDEAALLAEQSIRLDPRGPGIHGWYARLGIFAMLRSHTDHAVSWFEKARNANPGHPGGHAGLAAAFGLTGDAVRAGSALAEARKLSDAYSSLARVRQGVLLADPKSKVRDLFEATYIAGLRLAGMPEE